jgi:hypothetical protein
MVYRGETDGGLYLQDVGRINDPAVTAATLRPAAAVISGQINIFYVNELTEDIHRVIISDLATPTFTDTVFPVAVGGTPTALAVDEAGTQLAVATVAVAVGTAGIKRWNISDLTSITPTITPVEPTIDDPNKVCYKTIDSLDFDFSANLLAYGATSCIEPNTDSCGCAGDYSSVGVVDLNTEEFDYPFPVGSDSDSYESPVFDPFDNKKIAAVNIFGPTRRVVVLTAGSATDTKVANPGTAAGTPSWHLNGADGLSITFFNDTATTEIYTIDESGYTDGDLLPANSAVQQLLPDAATLPVHILDGQRPFTDYIANPPTFDPNPIDFGDVAVGETEPVNVSLLNDGNRTFVVSGVTGQADNVFNFIWTEPLPFSVGPGETVNLPLSFTPFNADGPVSESFTIVSDLGSWNLPFTVNTIAGAATDPDAEETGGVAHDEGEFIGPCFISQLLGQ